MEGEAHQEKHTTTMESLRSKVPKDSPTNEEVSSSQIAQVNDQEVTSQTTSKASRKPNTTKAKVGRTRRRDRHNRKSEDTGFKLVLRLLPPDLSEDQFVATLKTQIGDVKNHGVAEWYYVPGHYSIKFRSEPVYSRCYFSFNDMEQLEKFSKKVQPIRFVDDKDNAANAVLKISPYNKRLVATPPKSAPSKQSLEGTLNRDSLFQTFMKSLQILEERASDFSYVDISILKPLEKELAKKKSIENEIQKKTEMALVALTGDNEKKSKSKSKKKSKKKDKASKHEASGATAEAAVSTSRKRKKSKKKSTANSGAKPSVEKNNNVVILEAAGKKELQRRKKLQMEKERMTGNAESSKNKKKTRAKSKPSDSIDDSQNLPNVKLLKREIAEHS